MKNRILRWIKYNLVFALLPLLASIFFRYLADQLDRHFLTKSPEIIFFIIMISATTLDDLSSLRKNLPAFDFKIRISEGILLLSAIWSAFLYGAFLFVTIIGPDNPLIRERIFDFSIFLGIALFFFCTVIQIFIGKIEEVE